MRAFPLGPVGPTRTPEMSQIFLEIGPQWGPRGALGPPGPDPLVRKKRYREIFLQILKIL